MKKKKQFLIAIASIILCMSIASIPGVNVRADGPDPIGTPPIDGTPLPTPNRPDRPPTRPWFDSLFEFVSDLF